MADGILVLRCPQCPTTWSATDAQARDLAWVARHAAEVAAHARDLHDNEALALRLERHALSLGRPPLADHPAQWAEATGQPRPWDEQVDRMRDAGMFDETEAAMAAADEANMSGPSTADRYGFRRSRTDAVQVVQVIRVTTVEGEGHGADGVRQVNRYYSLDGKFLASGGPA